MTLHTKRMPKWLRFLVAEGWPFIVLFFALVIEFAHIATSAWLNVFLYNGDSLTLPIIRQTLAHNEPFLWVSSSQFHLFPEGLLYAISSTIAESIRASLVLNGMLNIFLLYASLRWMSGILLKTRVYFKQIFALGICLLLVLYMLLERQPLINSSSVATLFLFTSYYYGIVLAGAFVLAGMLFQASSGFNFRNLGKQQWIFVVLSFFMALLATFSDPIFIILFLAPVLVALLLAVILGGLRLKNAVLMGLPVLVGSTIGYVLRFFFKAFVGQSLGSHIITEQIPGTLTVFHNAISFDLHSKSGLLELSLVLLVMTFSLCYSFWWTYQKTHSKSLLDGRLLLLSLFSVLVPVFAVLFSIFTGSMVTRYLLPFFIFPLVGLFPLFSIIAARFRTLTYLIIPASVVGLAVVVLIGIVSVGKANRLLSSSFPDSKCVSSALGNKEVNGVGEYWVARPIGVYSNPGVRVAQINADLSPYLWQSNLGSYSHNNFTFMLVDKKKTSPRAITASDPHIPPGPSKISSCSDVYVYQYKPGSSGYKQLNDTIRGYYLHYVKIRASGKTAQLY